MTTRRSFLSLVAAVPVVGPALAGQQLVGTSLAGAGVITGGLLDETEACGYDEGPTSSESYEQRQFNEYAARLAKLLLERTNLPELSDYIRKVNRYDVDLAVNRSMSEAIKRQIQGKRDYLRKLDQDIFYAEKNKNKYASLLETAGQVLVKRSSSLSASRNVRST